MIPLLVAFVQAWLVSDIVEGGQVILAVLACTLFMFIATAPGSNTDIVSRVFVPGGGIDEDPVTGSAHSLLTTFWTKRLGRNSFTAFQASKRGGYLGCHLEGNRAILSGRCVTVIEGAFTLG